MNKNDILSYLKANKQHLKTKYGVQEIGLFGSYARGEEKEESDIDLIIEMRPKSLIKRMALKKELSSHFNKSVDLGYIDSMRHYIAHEIKKELVYA